MEITKNSHSEDLLELYCGGGTFTSALATNFKRILATEISKSSVELANKTFQANDISNIKVVRLSSEEFTEAYEGKRIFQRIKENNILFSDYNFTTVLVDPPRAGLDLPTCKLLCSFDKIVYISCNPVTLARDVEIMSATHTVEKVAAFDQFPYTHHLESGILLIKKTAEINRIVDVGEVVVDVRTNSIDSSSDTNINDNTIDNTADESSGRKRKAEVELEKK